MTQLDLSQSFGEVPIIGDWKLYIVSMRTHIVLDKGELVHYIDGKPKFPNQHPLRHYFHIDKSSIASHILSEIKAWSALTYWTPQELIQMLNIAINTKPKEYEKL